jgi:lipoprotein-anchoring transpeptidase ErfK/SrfK
MGRRVAQRRLSIPGSLLAGGLLLAACASGGAVGTASHRTTPASLATTGSSAAALPIPTLAVSPTDGAIGVSLDTPIKVTVDTGVIDRVVLHSDADLTALPGTLSPDGRAWTLTGALEFGSHYVVQASAHDLGGGATAAAGFTTIPVPSGATRLTTDVAPGDGATVGVGMPIILQFNAPIAPDKQAALISRIQVQTSTPIVGAWHWFGTQEVHWRPQDYWPSGTQVHVVAHFRGANAGGGVWGLGDWSSSFTIGAKHVSIIDAAAHQMQVFSGDQLIHTYPVSTGKPSSPTLSGTLFVWYKLQKVRMVSTSIGIPVNAPGGYDEQVFWDTAISTDGFYIHSAPWSVGSQGFANVSHGCVNLSPARAIEFFNFSQSGDVVRVVNTARVADFSDGEADWQIPFDQYSNTGGVAQPAPTPTATGGGGL